MLSEEQILIRDTARDFAKKVLAPKASENDAQSRFPIEAVQGMGNLGFLGMLLPPEYDGAGADQ